MKIVSLDPGGTTGYATFDSETQTWGLGEVKTDSGEHNAALLISAEYIGVVKLFCIMNRTKLIMSNRSNKDVTYLRGAELKRFGVWSGSKHARDAARHLLHYRIFIKDEKELLNVWRDNGARPS